MIKELCVENFTNIPSGIASGANRIELCDNLAEGGTTVSLGVLRKSLHYCHNHHIPVMSIVRPRGGDFLYTDDEKEIMLEDAKTIMEEGGDGLVVGALTAEHWIDEAFMEQLAEIGKNHELTFHMAFDEIPKNRQKEAIDWLAENQFTRILTHGGSKTVPILDTTLWLKELTEYADGRILILPGGGVCWENTEEVLQSTGATEVHGTKIVKFQ